jgi:hypothetical protein
MKNLVAFLIGLLLGGLLASSISRADTTKIEYNGQPVPSAMAPSISAMNPKMCRTGVSGAANTGVFSVSGGITIVDENCERVILSDALETKGLKVAAVAVLCEDRRVWRGMEMSGSPCPIGGSVGDAARQAWYKLHPEWFEELYGKTFTLPLSVANKEQ